MNKLQKVTAAWSRWVAQTDQAVLDTITFVQLRNRDNGGGYDIHISAWEADQAVADALAAALGCYAGEGWEPTSGNCKRQWFIQVDRDGLNWALTATTPHE